MNYDFIRKLAVKVSEQEAGAIIKLLLSHNIEAYAEGTEENKKEGRIYIAAGKETRLSNGNLYVAAADRARAVELLEANGYGEFICRDEQEAAVLSETENAMHDYYFILNFYFFVFLVIVVVVFLVLFLRGIVG